MKKLSLVSLLAVFAVSGAYAANAIDGNPMYRPGAGKAFSETTIASHSENTNAWALQEVAGYGITDKLSVNAGVVLSEADTFDEMAWNRLALGLDYRVLDAGNIKADVFGTYTIGTVWADHASFLDENTTGYTWTAGGRIGYVANDFTIAGHVAFDYLNTESFNWGDEGLHRLRLGLDAQYLIDNNWNVVAGMEYSVFTDDGVNNTGEWMWDLGVNYNIDANKYVGAFAGWEANVATGDWETEEGFTFGARFGMQF